MNNILLNNQCSIVNIVWIDRGIILTLIYYICKKYKILLGKNIIIDIKKYRKFIKYLFPELKFTCFKKHNSNNFYFNIRTIIKKQDIIIDYINNYDVFVYAQKIKIVPWYDMNDVLISYEYTKSRKLKIKSYHIFLNKFKCVRGNYGKRIQLNNLNIIWDIIIENKILEKYKLFNSSINVFNLINNFLQSNYTNTINNPKIYYVPINKYHTSELIEPIKTNSIGTDPISIEPIKTNSIGTDPNSTDPIVEPVEMNQPNRQINLSSLNDNDDKVELIKLITKKLKSINQLVKNDRNII